MIQRNIEALRQRYPNAIESAQVLDACADRIEVGISDLRGSMLTSRLIHDNVLRGISLACQKQVYESVLPHIMYEHAIARRRSHFQQKYIDYNEEFDEGFQLRRFRESLASIGRFARNRIDMTMENVKRCLALLALYPAAITSIAGTGVPRVSCIKIIDSESHNSGQNLIIIEFADGRHIVYKPTCLRGSSLIHEIIRGYVSPGLRTPLRSMQFGVVDDSAGFIEFLQGTNVVSGVDTVRNFYYQLGALLGMAHCLRITDLHLENVMVIDGRPVIADLETIFYRIPYPIDEAASVFQTGLIDAGRTSGIAGGGELWRAEMHEVPEFGGSSRIEYRKKVAMRQNRIHLGEQWEPPWMYSNDIGSGFSDAYRAICRTRHSIIEHIRRAAEEGPLRCRCLLRFTLYYTLIGRWLVQPSLGHDNLAMLNERLSSNEMLNVAMHPNIVRAEISDLLNGDVPYFWGLATDRHLYHRNGIVARDFFETTAVELIRGALDGLSDEDHDRQMTLIREWLMSEGVAGTH